MQIALQFIFVDFFWLVLMGLGRLMVPKWMNYWKSSKRPLTHPHFRKIMMPFFFANVMLKKPCLKVQNLQNYFFELKMTPLPPAFAIFPEIHQLW